eukprot:CAMPEP_0206531380 /NCGR_PEP_ID=MMETSP0325_2-20121206/3728_1 /ASSEMBLY_ACC=CAM_ASM_000347 /TAXON_ID=2866 /ORGANISM="Crypthecodinium cohnii, Strain Seligo" /LENGTH=195 /DNA_ID=CAMNT_0054027607 /DNA_START=67 /DNA_END=654 /DNA_ORIENTATION=-
MEWPPQAAPDAPMKVSGYMGHRTLCGLGVTDPPEKRPSEPKWERPLIARYTGFLPKGGSGVPLHDGLGRDHWVQDYNPVVGYSGHRPRSLLTKRGLGAASAPSLAMAETWSQGPGDTPGTGLAMPSEAGTNPKGKRLPSLEDACIARALAASGGKLNNKPSWTIQQEQRKGACSFPGYGGHKPMFWDIKIGPRAY